MAFNQFDCDGKKLGCVDEKTNDDKVKRIRCLFSGRKDAYSTCDLKSGESYVVKKPVADKGHIRPIF